MTSGDHAVVFDIYRFLGRYTCYSDECNGASLIREPNTTDATWKRKVADFFDNHPSEEFRNESQSILPVTPL